MKILLFANTDWYLFNFRLPLAKRLREAGHEVLLVSPASEYGARLEALGFRWIAAPMERRSLNPWREVALVRWLARLMRREGVDLVHGFTIKSAVYGSLAGRLARVPARINAVTGMGYVFTSDDPLARLLRPAVRLFLRLALSGANARLILQNPDDRDLFVASRLVDEAAIRLIPGSGVDCARFRPRTPPRADGPFRVVLPARVLWDKGLGEYAEAARLLRARGRDYRLLIAGPFDPGNPASVPEEQARGWEREGLVELLGHVADMPALFATVDAVALPSYREGLPKGLIEAAACALPLVTCDVPGCREVVSDGIDGLLVPRGDAGALADAIDRLANDPALCDRLGQAARAKALDQFDERIVVDRTIDVYREIIAGV